MAAASGKPAELDEPMPPCTVVFMGRLGDLGGMGYLADFQIFLYKINKWLVLWVLGAF